MSRLRGLACFLIILAPGLSGCAAVAVTGAAQGIDYTFNKVAYRTFTYPLANVNTAVLVALKRMQIKPYERARDAESAEIRAKTMRNKIVITMEVLTPKATRISVNATRYLIMKDKDLAVEIITQTAQVLGSR